VAWISTELKGCKQERLSLTTILNTEKRDENTGNSGVVLDSFKVFDILGKLKTKPSTILLD